MSRVLIFLILINLGFEDELSAQIPDIKFVQGDTMSLQKGKKNYFEVELRREAFTLVFKGNELHVCAGLEENLYEFTKPNTDINADFNSYFFIFKYLAGSPDSDFLSIEKDTGNSLNETHGARPAKDGYYQYTIRNVMNDGEINPISDFKKLFMALWLDSNRDQFIDEQELLWVKATLK